MKVIAVVERLSVSPHSSTVPVWSLFLVRGDGGRLSRRGCKAVPEDWVVNGFRKPDLQSILCTSFFLPAANPLVSFQVVFIGTSPWSVVVLVELTWSSSIRVMPWRARTAVCDEGTHGRHQVATFHTFLGFFEVITQHYIPVVWLSQFVVRHSHHQSPRS